MYPSNQQHQEGTQQQPDEQIQGLIKDRYFQLEQSLELDERVGICWAVLAHRDWTQLKHLALQTCEANDHNLEVLSNMKWPNLQKLNLQCNAQITTKGIEQMAKKEWPQLKELFLGDCIISSKIEDQGSTIILNLRKENWKRLWLMNCRISGQGLRPMLQFPQMELNCLILNKNLIGNQGARLLAMANMPKMELLYMEQCGIGNEGLKSLSKAQWKELLALSINFNKISQDGVEKLQLPNWIKIKEVWLQNSQKTFMVPSVLMEVQEISIGLNDEQYQQQLRKVFSQRFQKRKE